MSLQGCRVAPCWGQQKTQDALVWLAGYPGLTTSGCLSWIPAPGPPAPLLSLLSWETFPQRWGRPRASGFGEESEVPTAGTGTWSHHRGFVGVPHWSRSFPRAGPGPCSPPAPALGLACSRMELSKHTPVFKDVSWRFCCPRTGQGGSWESCEANAGITGTLSSPSARPGLRQSCSRRLRGGWRPLRLWGTETPLPSTSSLFHLTLPPRGLFPALTRENCPRTWLWTRARAPGQGSSPLPSPSLSFSPGAPTRGARALMPA